MAILRYSCLSLRSNRHPHDELVISTPKGEVRLTCRDIYNIIMMSTGMHWSRKYAGALYLSLPNMAKILRQMNKKRR